MDQTSANLERRAWLRSALKDWGGLTISVFALSLSAATAYFNLFRVVHDASILIDNSVWAAGFDEGYLTSYYAEADFVFANNGSRPISIVDMDITLFEMTKVEPKRGDCDFSESSIITRYLVDPVTDFEPFVVPAKDVKIEHVDFKLERDGRLRIEELVGPVAANPQPPKKASDLVACIKVRFMTSSGRLEAIEHPYSYTVGEGTSPGPMIDEQAIPLVKRTEASFMR